eukprot:4892785-Pyramimonas_sp.AAC.1
MGWATIASSLGTSRSHWKTRPAGAHAPELCRRRARPLAATAPWNALCSDAGDPVCDHWEAELAANYRGSAVELQRPQPRCPA